MITSGDPKSIQKRGRVPECEQWSQMKTKWRLRSKLAVESAHVIIKRPASPQPIAFDSVAINFIQKLPSSAFA